MSTIGDSIGIPHVLPNRSEQRLAKEKVVPEWTVPYPLDMIGIEIELEGVDRWQIVEDRRIYEHDQKSKTKDIEAFFYTLWGAKNDGSLRNLGVEFVSTPIKLTSLEPLLNHLYRHIRNYYPNAEFSDRCGIHFHFNFTNHTSSQVFAFLMVYAAFEKYIFNYAGGDRQQSNFCVPLQNQNLTAFRCFQQNRILHTPYFVDNIPGADHAKYSALNICRLRDIGTIEARHLPGTWDINHLVRFATIIQRTKEYAINEANWKDFQTRIETINSVSSFRQLIDDIYGDLSYVLCPNDDYKPLEEGVTFVKQQQILVREWAYKRPTYLEAFEKPEFYSRMSKFINKKSKARKFEVDPHEARDDILEDHLDREDEEPEEEEEISVQDPRTIPPTLPGIGASLFTNQYWHTDPPPRTGVTTNTTLIRGVVR